MVRCKNCVYFDADVSELKGHGTCYLFPPQYVGGSGVFKVPDAKDWAHTQVTPENKCGQGEEREDK